MLPVDYTTLFNSYSFNLVEIVSGWAQRRRWFAAFQNAVTRQICEHWGEEVAIAPAFVPKCILYMYTYIQIYIYMEWKKTTDCIWGFAKCNNNNNPNYRSYNTEATYYIRWLNFELNGYIEAVYVACFTCTMCECERAREHSLSCTKLTLIRQNAHLFGIWFGSQMCASECYATSSYGNIQAALYSNVLETSFPLTKQLIRWKTRFISLTFARY